jgi:hypothetical protein
MVLPVDGILIATVIILRRPKQAPAISVGSQPASLIFDLYLLCLTEVGITDDLPTSSLARP